MTVTFYNTSNRRKDVTKQLENGLSYSAKFKDEVNIANPTLIIAGHSTLNKNYVYIPTLNRYYFIKGQTILTGNRVQIDCERDVLTSFADSIYNSRQLITRNETIGLNEIADTNYPIAPNTQTRVIQFDDTPFFKTFDELTPCFVLTVAGK